MHLVVLGGGGAMGRITVRTLAEDARVSRITVADVNLAAAERTISWLEQGHDKAHAVVCDVRDEHATTEMLRGTAAVLNATDYPYNLHVMRAALVAHVSYADLGGLFHMTRRQYELDAAFKDAGLTAVLGIGSTPGITNLLARVAVDHLDSVDRLDVRIGSGDFRPSNAPFAAPYSIRTILDECTLQPLVYADGDWHTVPPMSGQEQIDFPPPVGSALAMHTLHSEVALFPVSFRDHGLRDASFKIAFPPAFLSQLKLLVDIGLASADPIPVRDPEQGTTLRIPPREFVAALLAARGTAAAQSEEPADCDVLRVIAQGTRDGAPARLVEEMVVQPYAPWHAAAGDIDTGVPLAIAGILLGNGGARTTGACGAEVAFEPFAFLSELTRYGMSAKETATRALR
ncbi:MAG: saccharopine dehydrogenase family protein [Ktedonobacterales bacterium]